jgi:hypothetical protein
VEFVLVLIFVLLVGLAQVLMALRQVLVEKAEQVEGHDEVFEVVLEQV